MIDLTNKRAAIFGLPGSGKSVLTKSILASTPSHLVYDPMDEHAGYHRYLPNDRNSVTELSNVIEKHVIKHKPKLFVIDEANRYIKVKPNPLPPGVSDLNDLSRHWGIAWVSVTRRPSQFHTDIVELCHYLAFFSLTGKNDYRYMEDLHQGLGDIVRALPKYHFAILEMGIGVTVHAPVAIDR